MADAVPLYPLYALLFADSGLSDAEISALLAIWSIAGVVAEVPTGALADRIPRRLSIAAGGVAQAFAYLLWTAFPGFTAFAAGFAAWGVGATLVSGALEAWLYDSLVALGEPERFQRMYGRINSCALLAQVPAALGATVLLPLGGFQLVGWASVGTCLGAAVLAARLPEPHRGDTAGDDTGGDTGDDTAGDTGGGYLATVRSGVVEVARNPRVRGAALVVALLTALDDIEEYFGLLAERWHVSPQWVPLALLAVPVAGAGGASAAGRIRDHWATPLLLAGVALFALAGLWASPPALVLVAAFYALYRGVLVVVNARLQERIAGRARATVTSVAGVGTELAGLVLFGAWALAGLPAALALAALVACVVPLGLRSRRRPRPRRVRPTR